MVMGRPQSLSAPRISLIGSACSAWVPCEKLSRATSMPALTSRSSTARLRLAGPMVQTIFALLTSWQSLSGHGLAHLSSAGAPNGPCTPPTGDNRVRATASHSPNCGQSCPGHHRPPLQRGTIGSGSPATSPTEDNRDRLPLPPSCGRSCPVLWPPHSLNRRLSARRQRRARARARYWPVYESAWRDTSSGV